MLRVKIKFTDIKRFFVILMVAYCVLARFFPFADNFIVKSLLFSLSILYLITNIKRVPIQAVIVIIAWSIFVVFSCLNRSNRVLIKDYIFTFNAFFYIFLVPLLFMSERNPALRLKELYHLSFFMVTVLCIILLIGGMSRKEYDYISMGSSILPFWAIIAQNAFLSHRKTDTITAAACGVFICLFASRGVSVSLLVILVIFIYIYADIKHKLLVLLLGVAGMALSSNISSMLMAVYNIFLRRNINIRFLYTILFRNQISDFNLTSGRTEIWKLAWESILERPFTGYGIMGDRAILTSYAQNLYTHNMILQILLQFGLILGGLLLFFLIYVGIKMFRASAEWKKIFLPFFLSSVLFLQFSSEYYLFSNFWLSIMIFCSYMGAQYDRRKRSTEEGS